jgi:hypothetical protein
MTTVVASSESKYFTKCLATGDFHLAWNGLSRCIFTGFYDRQPKHKTLHISPASREGG